MKVKYFQIFGGRYDGAIDQLRNPLDMDCIKEIRQGNERFRVEWIEGETAVLFLVNEDP